MHPRASFSVPTRPQERLRQALLALAGLAALLVLTAVPATAQADADREAVRQAVLDYVEGVYEVDPSRIERSVHPDLAKTGYYLPQGADTPRILTMTHAQLLELAANYNKDGQKVPAGAPKTIEILDLLDRTASVKLTASWGVDYLLLGKEDGRWKIRMVLWQSLPAE